eukprot:16644-Pelagococcus_subviridis.AAC.1
MTLMSFVFAASTSVESWLVKRRVELENRVRARGLHVDNVDVLRAEKDLPRRQRRRHEPRLLGLQIANVIRAVIRRGSDRDRYGEVRGPKPDVDHERVRRLVIARVPRHVFVMVLPRRRPPGADEVKLM